MAQADLFSPFRRRSEQHEDRLTWGLMVALKYSPELQRFLRGIVLRDVPNGRWSSSAGWDPAVMATQTSSIGTGAEFVVSVLISDTSLATAVEVERADRTARYDGVVEYPDGLVLIIENKPRAADVWEGQLSPSKDLFDRLPDDVELFERAVSLEWAEVLEGFLNYAGSTVAPFAEQNIAGDFLSFVEDLHPSLSPYRTFELCGARSEALERRLEGLLESIGSAVGLGVGTRPGSGPYLQLPNDVVQRVCLSAHMSPGEGEGLILRQSIWPADTVT
ncbi:MAG: hypothetical protein HOL45_09335, partial [Chloroflexi bacterium]|nr:hypothetical protein [Chloroflexota bacterium]